MRKGGRNNTWTSEDHDLLIRLEALSTETRDGMKELLASTIPALQAKVAMIEQSAVAYPLAKFAAMHEEWQQFKATQRFVQHESRARYRWLLLATSIASAVGTLALRALILWASSGRSGF